MLARIWRTRIDPTRTAEYERFERERSLAMFRRQEGLLGVLFLRTEEERGALSLWRSRASVTALATSPSYRETVAALEATGLLSGSPSVEVFEVRGGFVRDELASDLARETPP